MTAALSSEATSDRSDSDGVSYARWFVLALVCVIYLLVSADRANLGIALPFITEEFGISHTEAGFLVTLMFLFYTAMQIPAGFACKRVGPGYLMAGCLLLTALASFLLSTSTSYADVRTYRSLLGLAEAPITICCVTVINIWFSTREKGTAAGLLFASSKMGPVLCPPVAVLILHVWGWRDVFLVFAGPVAVLGVAWLILARARMASPRLEAIDNFDGGKNAGSALVELHAVQQAAPAASWADRLMRRKPVRRIASPAGVFRSWNILAIAAAYLCMVGILNVMLAWMPSYLLTAKHLSGSSMGILSAAPFAGAVCGNVAGGWISDRLLNSRRKPLMMIGALLTSLTFLALVLVPNNTILIGLILLALGTMFGLGYPAFSVYPMSITTKEVYPLAFSVINTAASLGAAAFPLATGFILDHSRWETVFYFLAASSLICLVLLFAVDEPIAD